MNSETFESLKGQFLIAMPELKDPNFSHGVSVICEHTPRGAMGLVVNKVFPNLKSKHIFQELGINFEPGVKDLPIYIGGPIKQEQIFVLHGAPFDWKGTSKISTDLALTNTIDILNAISINEAPSNFLIVMGYVRWASGQLEAEIMANAWINTDFSEEVLFKSNVDKRWEKANNLLGISPEYLSYSAGHA